MRSAATRAPTLFHRFGEQLAVEFPSPRTDDLWSLTSQGWVGYIPLTPDLAISLAPKVPLGNLFRMLEYAYRLDFELLDGLSDSATLQEFYERLANVLARRVLDRSRRGLYRAYVPDTDELAHLRGRLDLERRLREPWSVRLPCEFHEHTADLPDNQILAWTLQRIARSGGCSERVLPTVRSAYRALLGSVAIRPWSAQACIGRLYGRLNDDYRALHGLCRFFLESSGPTHERGDRDMIPFLVPMAPLFEKLVAAWMQCHLPPRYRVEAQERVDLIGDQGLRFEIDLVLYDAEAAAPVAVLDTKYKAADRPKEQDVQQVVAYAESKGCTQAYLVYPTQVPFATRVGGIRVDSLTFALNGELEENGRRFAADLLARVPA